ncbi:MAG: hypothetical protein B6247_30550 [Candidatus Parabeggiatoa sp. nov. 2]|nr:MAG: hypothetical protein B6247_30550 [Beggiatoa sp. 4572_84]
MLMRLLLLYILILLSGCGIFGDKDNTDPPAPLVEFMPTLTLKTLWTAHAGGGTDKSYLKIAPAFYNDQLFTASPEGHLRAFNFKVLATPRISQGIVVVRTIDGKLFALDSKTGERLWVYDQTRVPLLTLRGTSSPIVTHDAIIAGFDNGKLAILKLQTGQLLGEYLISEPRGRSELERMVDIDADPLLVGSIIYVTSYQGRTVALKRGKLLWERKLSSHAGLGVDADYLYISDTKSHVWALDRYSGDDWWKQDKLQARNLTAPVSIGDYVVVGDMEGYLHWMRRDNGQFVTRYRIGKTSITVPPLVVDDILVAYNSQGKIVALRPE